MQVSHYLSKPEGDFGHPCSIVDRDCFTLVKEGREIYRITTYNFNKFYQYNTEEKRKVFSFDKLFECVDIDDYFITTYWYNNAFEFDLKLENIKQKDIEGDLVFDKNEKIGSIYICVIEILCEFKVENIKRIKKELSCTAECFYFALSKFNNISNIGANRVEDNVPFSNILSSIPHSRALAAKYNRTQRYNFMRRGLI